MFANSGETSHAITFLGLAIAANRDKIPHPKIENKTRIENSTKFVIRRHYMVIDNLISRMALT